MPTKVYGNSYLSNIGTDTERLLAALVDKQVPINEVKIAYWINRYSKDHNSKNFEIYVGVPTKLPPLFRK